MTLVGQCSIQLRTLAIGMLHNVAHVYLYILTMFVRVRASIRVVNSEASA